MFMRVHEENCQVLIDDLDIAAFLAKTETGCSSVRLPGVWDATMSARRLARLSTAPALFENEYRL